MAKKAISSADQGLRQSAYNMAHNRSRGKDAVKSAKDIYNFMKESDNHRSAMISANNQVSAQAGTDELIEKAKEIRAFLSGD